MASSAGAMSDHNLASVNLNLLVALDALLRERSVGRAASHVGVTQPAMSHSLRRLRELFGDPLLVRGRRGTALTPRAERLARPLHQALQDIGRAIRDESAFVPRSARRRFTFAAPDFLCWLLLPPLTLLVSKEAPGIDFVVRPLARVREDWLLETGEVDLALGAEFRDVPGLRTMKLYREKFACVARGGHPEIKGRITLQQYVRLSHVLISPHGEGTSAVDQALERLGRARRVAIRVPSFLAAPLIVARSDLILTAPRRLLETFAVVYPLQVLDPPVRLGTFDEVAAWHERFELDPAHQWLRGVVTRAAGTLA